MPQQKPNVVLFTTDQHRGDHLSIAGHTVVETPNVDSFVNQGAYFPNAYTEISSTTGARRCLHAGQKSYACGLVGYSSVEWHERNTLAQTLADAGYHCINVGWRNMHPRRKLFGFHHVIPHDLRAGVDDYAEWLKKELGPGAKESGHGCDPNGWAGRPWHLPEEYHPCVWTTDTAMEEITRRDPTRPFFIWMSYLRPHSPYDPPKTFWDMYIDRELPEIPVGDWAERHNIPNPGLERTAWQGRFTDAQNQRMRAGYMGNITHLDNQLGRLMQWLQRDQGVYQNTLFVFTSDHGDMMGDHHLHRKTYAYEGSARIPMLIRYPAGVDLPTGSFENVVGLQDVMPTILDICGVPVQDSVTGTSMLSAVRGKPWREFFHGEHSPCYHPQSANHFLTDAKEKYIWNPVTGEEMMFDLVNDRQELHELAGVKEYKERLEFWRRRLIDLLAERPDGFSDGRQLITKPEGYSPVVET